MLEDNEWREMPSATLLSLPAMKSPFRPRTLFIWRVHKSLERALPSGVLLVAFLIHDKAEELSERFKRVEYGVLFLGMKAGEYTAVVAAA